jgi:hypothetical protein
MPIEISKGGNAYRLSGVSTLDFGVDPAFDATSEITLVAATRMKHVVPWQFLLAKSGAYQLSFGYGPVLYGGGFIDGDWRSVSYSDLPTDDGLHWAAFTYSSTDMILRLYLDGTEVATNDISGLGLLTYDISTSTGSLFIHHPTYPRGETTIDKVALYLRQLTASEIQTIASAGRFPSDYAFFLDFEEYPANPQSGSFIGTPSGDLARYVVLQPFR